MSRFNFRMTMALVLTVIVVATMKEPTFLQICGVGLVLFGMAAVSDLLDFILERRRDKR
jgi:hypothetical protein